MCNRNTFINQHGFEDVVFSFYSRKWLVVEGKDKCLSETLVLFSTFIFLATLRCLCVIGSAEFLSVTFGRLMEKRDSTQGDRGSQAAVSALICTYEGEQSCTDRAATLNHFCEWCILSTTQIYPLALFSGLSCSLALHVFAREVLQARKGAGVALESLSYEKKCVLLGALGMKTHLGKGEAWEGQREGLIILGRGLSNNQGTEERKGVGLDIENGNIPAAGVGRVAL